MVSAPPEGSDRPSPREVRSAWRKTAGLTGFQASNRLSPGFLLESQQAGDLPGNRRISSAAGDTDAAVEVDADGPHVGKQSRVDIRGLRRNQFKNQGSQPRAA